MVIEVDNGHGAGGQALDPLPTISSNVLRYIHK